MFKMASSVIGDADPDKVLTYLTDVERVGSEILSDKRSLVDLDRKRQENREALHALRSTSNTSHNTWMCMGKLFIKMQSHTVSGIINEDQSNTQSEIEETQRILKTKVDKLRDMEGKPELMGFHLKPMSKDELGALGK